MFDLSPDLLVRGLTWYVAFLFSITLHEAAHALAAYRLGDPTAYLGGQVTLNPLPHIRREPFGTVLVPILTFLLNNWMMGWASAPYDPFWAARNPRRAAWMALAGPAGNLVVVVATGIALRVGLAAGFFTLPDRIGFENLVAAATAGGAAAGLASLLSILFMLNLLLFAFNLLPLPPLDGASALPLVLPEATALRYLDFMRQPIMAIIGLLIAWRVFGSLFAPIRNLALRALYAGVF
jgi:Zn-dependent protease